MIYAIIWAAGLYGSYLFSNRRIGFWKGADGSIYYKGAVIIYLIYLVALITRIAIDLAFIGPSAFTFAAPSQPLGATAIDGELIADAMLALGAGLLIGRNFRVLKRYDAITAGKEVVPDTPPKTTLL